MNIIIGLYTSFLNNVRKEKITNNTDITTSPHFSLTPSLIEKEVIIHIDKVESKVKNKAYQPILDIAGKLQDKDVKNIALTGHFGSGKSSVLLTLERDFPQYNYLNISLATLDCIEVNKDNRPPTEGCDKLSENDTFTSLKHINTDALNRKIEYSILQQIVYKEKAHKIPQSRFKRIKHIDKHESYSFAVYIVLFFVSVCVLFEPKFLYVDSLHQLISCSQKWKLFWDILSFGYIILGSIYALNNLIIKTYNNQINKLNVKDGEIEISESTSIFNKHLDEIIYFFEVTEYDVIVIEDLDRFETHNIFLKLRELNNLLNNSKAISRSLGKIVFIYAIKDDMFKDTSRTKFFDYISTVIPVINPSNSRDKLFNALREKGDKDISEDVCMDLGIYIDDMRILKNIVNEYIQYRHKLEENISAKKLLGMILYKNYHPDDFAKLHNQDGIVYEIISNRVKYHNNSITEKDNEIETLKNEINKIIDFYSDQKTKELRALYVMRYIQENNKIEIFTDGSNNFTPNELIENADLFEKLENDKLQFHRFYENYSNYRSLSLSIKFENIEKKVDANYSFRQRLNLLYPKRVEEINSHIKRIQQEQLELRTLPLCEILTRYSANDFYNDTKKNRLIAFLIRAGYIDENYYDYISYFYSGVMTPSDREFILDIKIGQRKEYNYTIYKPKAVINDIHESHFSKLEILNISLLDYIVENRKECLLQFNSIINSIVKHNLIDFVTAYYMDGKHPELFFSHLFIVWNDFFNTTIFDEQSKEIAHQNLEMLIKHFPKSRINDFQNEQFKKYISTEFEFISQRLDIILLDNVKFLTESLNINYDNLNVDVSVSKELMDFLINGSYYELSSENLQCVLSSINFELREKYENASYSSILETENNNLISYINDYIGNFTTSIFPNTSIQENEVAIISILNLKDFCDEFKIEYLSKQNTKINLSKIDKIQWDVAIKANIIKPIWRNIEKYISSTESTEFNSIISDFISKNSSILGRQKTKGVIDDSTDSKLFVKLLGDNILSLGSYELIRSSFDRVFEEENLINLHFLRMEILINTGAIKFNEFNFYIVDSHFQLLVTKFIVNNKLEYFHNMNLYPLNEFIIKELLKSNELDLIEKEKIIQSLSPSILAGDSEFSDLICGVLNSINRLSIDRDFALKLLEVGSNQQQKLNIVVKMCTQFQYVEEIIRLSLMYLGGDYYKIALQDGHRRSFINNKENKILAKYLEDNRFIRRQIEVDGMIRINARKI